MNDNFEGKWPQSKRDALIRLLDDDDPEIYKQIRKTLLSIGKPAQKWLQPHTLSDNKLIRMRAREILRYCELKRADEDLLVFCLGRGDLELETGLWLFAKSADPSINLSALKILFDDMLLQYGSIHHANTRYEKVLLDIHDYLTRFITVSEVTRSDHSAYLYIDKALTNKMAHRDLLVVICMLAAKRFGIQFEAVKYQGKVGLYSPSAPSWIGTLDDEGSHFKIFKTDVDVHDSLSNRQILMHICRNLHQLYKQTCQDKHMKQNLYYLSALADSFPGSIEF